MPSLWVNGIVAVKDKQPYVQLSNDERILAQLTMAEARNFAIDILQMAARSEADAMIVKFFEKAEFPMGAAEALMQDFRDFRAALDQEAVEKGTGIPPEG